jgi:hypothetical protein
MAESIQRPPSPSGATKSHDGFKPSDYNPELANTEMVKGMMDKLPTPAIVSKKFTVFQGLLKSLNHTEKNKTFIDTTLLSSLMDEVSRNSVNVEGALFNNFWAYMMHPIFNIMQGGMMTPTTQPEEQPSFLGRIWNRVRGKDTSAGAQTNG